LLFRAIIFAHDYAPFGVGSCVERQQKEYEAEQARREKQCKARLATFDRILEQAPAAFTATQLRLFL
jgi:hypothetical protein